MNNLISFADGGILGGSNLSDSDLKNGNIHTDDLPRIITGAIDFLMGFAGTISVVFIIIGAYQILFGAISGDKAKGQATVKLALTGFALSACAWIIIKIVIDNFS
ncbi:MAG: hypothetical protein PHR68_05030 [Candidatus Gracilibacteria bacterium]|nr:hypothetical protein [Candidatus Gracilibacteria bacterium]